jgi:hypothetical protein
VASEDRTNHAAAHLAALGALASPVLSPERWTGRHTRFCLAGAVLVLAAWLIEVLQTTSSSGLRAGLGAAVAIAIAGFALSLRGATLPPVLLGGFVIFCGMMSWTWTNTRAVTWTVYGIGGLLILLWTVPWFRDLIRLPRLGSAWLGLAYWPLGIISAVLTAHWAIGAQRVAYFGVVALVAVGIVKHVRKTGADPSIGIVVAFLLGLAALVLAGSGNVFDDVHAVPDTPWGSRMGGRFWGGPGLLYHPNSIAIVAVIIALRIAPDRSFLRWQRMASLGVAGLFVILSNSRTAWGLLGAAALIHVLLLARAWWRQRRADGGSVHDDGLGHYRGIRQLVAAALVPFLFVGVVFIGMGGTASLFQSRYQNKVVDTAETNEDTLDLTSGRLDTWRQVIREFRSDATIAKVFGNNDDPRGAVVRESTGPVKDRPELTTDNSAIGALRRAGVLGCVAFLLGLGLLLWHALRRNAPAWFTLVAVASLATIPWADWLLGGVGGTLWVFLLGAEAWLMLGRSRSVTPDGTAPAGDAADPSAVVEADRTAGQLIVQ